MTGPGWPGPIIRPSTSRTGVISIPPDTEVCEATKMMIEEKIGCLPVVEDNRLVGLITETDVLMQYVKECEKR